MNPFRRNPENYRRQSVLAAVPDVKDSDGSVTMRLYDPIDSYGGDWGVSAKEFTASLDALPEGTSQIQLLVNSPGGEVWEGLAIMNALRSHPAKVVAVVEGIAASSASFIVASADEVRMMPNAEMFVHKAWGLGIGNADDFTKLASDLSHEDRNIASVYATRTGTDVEAWMSAMSDETWYSADEAVAAGLADSVVSPPKGAEKAKAQARSRFDLSALGDRANQHIAASLTPAAEHKHTPLCVTNGCTHEPPSASASGSIEEKEGPEMFSDTQIGELRAQLGVSEDADAPTVLAALKDALSKKPETPAVNEDALTALRDEVRRISTENADLKAVNARTEKTAFFDAATRDGRLKPADRETWETRYDKSPEVVRDILGARAANSEVPLAEIGKVGGPDDGVEIPAFNDHEAAAMASLTGAPKEAFLNG